MRFHILDVETVGLSRPEKGSGVCELSIREVDGDFNEIEHFYSKLDPEAAIAAGATAVHGIRNRDVEDEPTLDEYLNIVLPENIWAEGQEPVYFIAHNSSYDGKFLLPYIKCGVKMVDTLLLARRYYADAENHKLGTLAVILDLDTFSAEEAHGAGADTLVLESLVKRMSKDTGLTLEELCLDAQRREPIVAFTFGKYRKKLLADVKRDDPGYITWCLAKMDALHPDMREALEAL